MLNFLDDGDLGRVRRSIYVLLSAVIFCHYFQPNFSTGNGFLGFTPSVRGLEVGPQRIFAFLFVLIIYFTIRFYHLSEIAKKGILDSKLIDEKLRISSSYASAVGGITGMISGVRTSLVDLRKGLEGWPGHNSYLIEQEAVTEQIGKWHEDLKLVRAIDVEQIRECQVNLRQLVKDYQKYGVNGDYQRVVYSLVNNEKLISSVNAKSERSLISAVEKNRYLFEYMSEALTGLQEKVTQAFSDASSQVGSLEAQFSNTLAQLNDNQPLKEALTTIKKTQEELEGTARSIHLVNRDFRFTNLCAYFAIAIAMGSCAVNLWPEAIRIVLPQH